MSVPANVEQNPAAEGQDARGQQQAGANPDAESLFAQTPTSGAASEEPESSGIDYFRNAINRIRGASQETHDLSLQAPPASPGPVQESERPEGSPPPEVPSSAEAAPAQRPAKPRRTEKTPEQPGVITLTQEELDRRVQAETDRRIAKQQREEALRQQKQEELELRRWNPSEYVRRLEEKEAAQAAEQAEVAQLTSRLNSQILEFDEAVLHQFVGSLPPELIPEVVKAGSTIPGLEGRKVVAKETVKALRQHWLNEGAKTARQRLLQDQGFVKEVFARYSGNRVEPEPATPSLPISSAPRPTNGEAESAAVNAFMRGGAAALRQTTR